MFFKRSTRKPNPCVQKHDPHPVASLPRRLLQHVSMETNSSLHRTPPIIDPWTLSPSVPHSPEQLTQFKMYALLRSRIFCPSAAAGLNLNCPCAQACAHVAHIQELIWLSDWLSCPKTPFSFKTGPKCKTTDTFGYAGITYQSLVVQSGRIVSSRLPGLHGETLSLKRG